MEKVLLVLSSRSENLLIGNLYLRLSKHINVEIGIDYFWKGNRKVNYKIIPFQWLEELFGWNNIEESDIEKLIEQIFFGKKGGTKFVITRHNILLHNLRGIYDLVVYKEIYKNCDAVIHSNESVKDLKKDIVIIMMNIMRYILRCIKI